RRRIRFKSLQNALAQTINKVGPPAANFVLVGTESSSFNFVANGDRTEVRFGTNQTIAQSGFHIADAMNATEIEIIDEPEFPRLLRAMMESLPCLTGVAFREELWSAAIADADRVLDSHLSSQQVLF